MYSLFLISTEICIRTAYVNEKDVNGLVIWFADVTVLRATMDKLLKDDSLCANKQKNERLRYDTLITVSRIGGQYYRLYREIVEQQSEQGLL